VALICHLFVGAPQGTGTLTFPFISFLSRHPIERSIKEVILRGSAAPGRNPLHAARPPPGSRSLSYASLSNRLFRGPITPLAQRPIRPPCVGSFGHLACRIPDVGCPRAFSRDIAPKSQGLLGTLRTGYRTSGALELAYGAISLHSRIGYAVTWAPAHLYDPGQWRWLPHRIAPLRALGANFSDPGQWR